MDAQRFIGKTVKEAYAAVRMTLGRDAMILEQKQHNGQIELLATLDEAGRLVGDPQMLAPMHASRLVDQGFSKNLVDTVPGSTRGWESILRFLIGKVAIEKTDGAVEGRWRLLGPPGVGKTTMLIKLLAQAVAQGVDPENILLLSTDQSKLGAGESLALAAEVLSVQWLATTPEGLPGILMEKAQKPLILIDSVGSEIHRQTPLQSVRDIGILPANWQVAALERLQSTYRRLGVYCYAATFVDHTEQLGSILSLLMGSDTPLSWISTGDRLPDDIQGATHDYFLERLLFHVDRPQFTTMFA